MMFVLRIMALLLLISIPSSSRMWAAEFHSLFTPHAGSDEFSTTQAVSADGSVVAGLGRWRANTPCRPTSPACGLGLPFVWTEGKGIEFLDTEDVVLDPNWLGLSPPFNIRGIKLGFPPRAIADDGETFVGQSIDGKPFRWSRTDGAVDLGALPGYLPYGDAWDISADGSVVVGYLEEPYSQAFRWTEADGMTGLGDLPGGRFFSRARGVSADGSVVVGESVSELDAGTNAFRWTEQSGMVSLGVLPGHSRSKANDVSANGLVIVGKSEPLGSDTDDHAFRWTPDEGMADLGVGEALATNSDGTIVVGTGIVGALRQRLALVWDQEHGARTLSTVLADNFGLAEQLQGWSLTAATGISEDGTTIVGDGYGPTGKRQAWRAAINPTRLAGLLQPGDADQDFDFDQMDLVRVQAAGKYLTGQVATWGEGDWNGAPGGIQGAPPEGDGVFNQHDVMAALRQETYLTGPYDAGLPNGPTEDIPLSVDYDAAIVEVAIGAPAGARSTPINSDSVAGIFTTEAVQNLLSTFDNDTDANIFKATFGTSFESLSFGPVVQPALSLAFLREDPAVAETRAGGGNLDDIELIYVPEPPGWLLLAGGLLVLIGRPEFCCRPCASRARRPCVDG